MVLCQVLGRRMGQERLRGRLPVPPAQGRRSHLRQVQMRIQASGSNLLSHPNSQNDGLILVSLKFILTESGLGAHSPSLLLSGDEP